MVTRMQVTLDPEQHRRAREKAHAAGISLAGYIRRLIDRDLDVTADARPDITSVFALGDSGGSDIARHQDEYIAEALEADHGLTPIDR